VQYPQRLESEGLAQPGTIYKYAIGKLVLYVPNNSPLNLSLGLHALQSPEAKRIATPIRSTLLRFVRRLRLSRKRGFTMRCRASS